MTPFRWVLPALLVACSPALPSAPDAAGSDPADAATDVPDAAFLDAPDASDAQNPDAGEPAPPRVEGPDGWTWTEPLVAPDVTAPDEPRRPECARSGDVAALFGTATPPSDRGLLHHLAGGDRGAVLLVHGANTDALQSFGPAPFGAANDGLARRLADAGWSVYAVTFAHPHGGNLKQARVLAAAVERLAALEAGGVRIVAHSKGNIAAWALLSGLSGTVPTRASRWVAVAAPLDGIDFTFAYPGASFAIVATGQCAPLPWDRAILYGAWTDTLERSVYAGGGYPGQAELLVRHDATAGLSLLQTDALTTYEGGTGTVSHSLGIDAAIAQGGNLMARLASAGLPARIGFAALAGDSPVIALSPSETRAASDGLLLLESATAVERVGRPGTATIVHGLNHLQLVSTAAGQDAIAAVLE